MDIPVLSPWSRQVTHQKTGLGRKWLGFFISFSPEVLVSKLIIYQKKVKRTFIVTSQKQEKVALLIYERWLAWDMKVGGGE